MLQKVVAALFIVFAFQLNAEVTFKPYTKTLASSKSINALKPEISKALMANQFVVIGQYMPAEDQNRFILIVTHPELTSAVQKVGGLSAFGSTLRIGLTKENGQTVVSYTTPEYWCRAYFTDDFDDIASNVAKVTTALDASFKNMPGYVKEGFGSKKGLDAKDLEDYNYMMGMPKVDDTEELAEFEFYATAVSTIDANLRGGVENVKQVYKYNVPGKNLTVYGLALSGEDGESKFVPIIDKEGPMHTAFLPYEILVMDDEVHMLHGRFRIALSFPDLTMGTFTKIMSTPGDIEDMMKTVVE